MAFMAAGLGGTVLQVQLWISLSVFCLSVRLLFLLCLSVRLLFPLCLSFHLSVRRLTDCPSFKSSVRLLFWSFLPSVLSLKNLKHC